MEHLKPNLVLQRVSLPDLETLASGGVPDAVLGRYAEGALPPDFAARRALGLQHAQADGRLAGAMYYICEGQQVVGGCGFKDAGEGGWVEVGYGIAPAHQGRGVGSQALAALCRIAFDSGQIQAVRACIEPDNAASGAIARKLGFVAGGPVVEEDGTCVIVWTLVEPDLPKQAAA